MARCRETLFAQPTHVVTPVEFVLGNSNLAGHDVWLFSAGADNSDSVAAVLAARARGANLHILTRNLQGAAVMAARADAAAYVHAFPVADIKDGFLATHSLVGSVLALLFAGDQLSGDPVGEVLAARAMDGIAAVLSSSAREAMAARFAALRRQDLLLVVADPSVRAVAELIETSAWEAALCPVQLTDARNFAHGRHSWLHHRAADTFLLALVGHETGPLWQRSAGLLPQIRSVTMEFGDGGRFRSAIGIVEGLAIVESMGSALGIDPGKPSIGDFGRAIYEDDGLLSLSRELGPATRHKYAAILARDDIAAPGCSVRRAAAEQREALAAATVGGIVLDYDGTIITDDERFGVPRPEIAAELVRLDTLGVRLGIATGRGGSGGKALRDVLPTDLHSRVTIGYYNGAYIQPLSVDIEQQPPPADPILAETFAWLEARPELFVGAFEGRFSNAQISVKLDNLADCTSFPLALWDCPPIESGSVRFALSGHSFDFFAATTSKQEVVEQLREGLPGDALILCAGDSGAPGGNDHELLAHALGISVGTVCGEHESCWTLYGTQVTGPDALLKLLGAVKRDGDGIVRIDVSALGLDSFCETSTNREHDAPAA